MRKRRDELLQPVRDSNPSPSLSVDGWSRTSEGKATKERVRAEIASEETAVFSRQPTVADDSRLPPAVATARPGRLCSRVGRFEPCRSLYARMARYFHVPAPPRLAGCVLDGGAVGVFPYPASMDEREACSSTGAAIPIDGRSES